MMRAISLLPMAALLATTACQVTEDKGNQQVSVQYNGDVAENAAADVGNTAQNIAGTIAADAKREGGKIKDKLDEHRAERDSTTANTAAPTKDK